MKAHRLLLSLLLAPALAAAAPVAIINGTVVTGGGETIERGLVLIDRGRIVRVGRGEPPAGAEVIDAAGAVVTAGLVDPLTSLGVIEIDLEAATRDDHQSGEERLRAGFRAADGYNPASTVIAVTRLEGVTSVGVLPQGGLVSGQSAWVDLDGATSGEAIVTAPLALHVRLQPDADGRGGGHATALLRLREAFDDARTWKQRRPLWERNQSRPFAASRLDLEALALALGGGLRVVFHANRAAELLAVLALAREFKLRPLIAGGAEAWQVAKQLAAAKVPVIVLPLLEGPNSFDTLGAREDNAALLQRAGVPLILSTGETHNARKLRQTAGNAVRAGLPWEAALQAMTRGPADAFGLGDRYGTLAAGKVANLVVWSGDPLETSTRVRALFIRGRRIPLRSRQTELLERYRALAR